jgi:hypothetical protein
MPWRDRRSLDIAGDSQLSRIKTEQAILNLFDRDHLGNRLSVFRDNEFCLSGLHFIHNCQTLRFELSRRDCFQEWHLTMVIIPWSNSFKVCGNYAETRAETRDKRRETDETTPMNRNNGAQRGLFRLCHIVPHRPYFRSLSTQQGRDTAVRSPHCVPNGLYLSLFRLIQKVLRRSP